jgi:hypothetical protein
LGDVPVPGWVLRKGYGKTPREFIEAARSTDSMLRTVMAETNLVFNQDIDVLDWGCATGKVLQEFRKEVADSKF